MDSDLSARNAGGDGTLVGMEFFGIWTSDGLDRLETHDDGRGKSHSNAVWIDSMGGSDQSKIGSMVLESRRMSSDASLKHDLHANLGRLGGDGLCGRRVEGVELVEGGASRMDFRNVRFGGIGIERVAARLYYAYGIGAHGARALSVLQFVADCLFVVPVDDGMAPSAPLCRDSEYGVLRSHVVGQLFLPIFGELVAVAGLTIEGTTQKCILS